MSITKTSRHQSGFTLIEMVVVIVIMGILASVAVKQVVTSVDTAKYDQTEQELDQLAFAIRGNPSAYGQGTRTDFGYVGDIGAFPPNLDALVQNPGGYATWKGPYIDRGIGNTDFKTDGWGTNYSLTDTLLRSTGSGSNIDKVFADSHADLLSNSVTGYIRDANSEVPGSVFKDSVWVHLQHPNGTGSMVADSVHPNGDGYFSFSGIAVGSLTLKVVYVPNTDTITVPLTVYPGKDAKLMVVFPADLW
jgi:prepilin-type N-terminal cleavage/methylation domain-containing protein